MEEIEEIASANIDQLLATEIAAGLTLGDILSIEWMVAAAGNLITAFLILIFAFIVSGWVGRRIRNISKRYTRVDQTLFSFLGALARYAILAFAAVFVLNRFGIQTTSIVAIIGAAGLAIGLALQGTLTNIAAGVMMVIFRPVRIGDFVEIGGYTGTVKEIALMFTELATVGNVQIIIPNSQVWGSPITNYSSYDQRRAEWTFGVGYGANLAEAERIIKDTIMSDPRSLSEPEPFIQVNNLGDFSVDFLVRVWVKSADYFGYQADIKRKVKEALDAGGVEIPFPTRTVFERREAS